MAEGDAVACDPEARRPGRGAYLCERPECLESALRRQALARALRAPVKITDETLDCIGEWQRSASTR